MERVPWRASNLFPLKDAFDVDLDMISGVIAQEMPLGVTSTLLSRGSDAEVPLSLHQSPVIGEA